MTKEDTIPDTALEIEDLEIEREIVNIDFEIGDNVVYPHHGAGQVVKKEEKNILGEVREYLTIKILHNDMTVMVPCANAGKAGLRRVIDEETVKKVLAVLAADVSEMPKNWNRRFKHNRDKIKTGDIYELAEVVRNLAVREQDKGLSTGEKQMYTRAKKILASEMMYALEKTEDEAEAYLDEILLAPLDELAAATHSTEQHTYRALGGRGLRLAARRGRSEGVRRGRRAADDRVVAGRAARGRDRARSSSRCPTARRRPRAASACAAARRARSPCAPRSPRRGARRTSSSTTRRGRSSSPTLFTRVLDALADADCAIAAARVTDTVKEADDGVVVATLDRSRLWAVQTPQAFRRAALGGRAGRGRRDPRRAPPTTRGWSSAPAAPCAWWSPRPRTSRSRRRTTCAWPT